MNKQQLKDYAMTTGRKVTFPDGTVFDPNKPGRPKLEAAKDKRKAQPTKSEKKVDLEGVVNSQSEKTREALMTANQNNREMMVHLVNSMMEAIGQTKAPVVQVDAPTIPGSPRKWTFKIKRDSRGYIEEVSAEAEE